MTLKRSDEMLHSAPVLLHKRVNDAGKLVGYASVFDVLDLNGDTIIGGAFKASIAARPSVPLLWAHNPERVIGRVAVMREDHHGLLIEAAMNLGTQEGREAHASIKAGDVEGLSIGFRTKERDGVKLKAIDVFEISAVAIAANPAARILSVKGAVKKVASFGAFERHLRAGGVTRAMAKKMADQHWGEIGDENAEVDGCVFCAKSYAAADVYEFRGELACSDCIAEFHDGIERKTSHLAPLKAALEASAARWRKS